MQRRFGRVRGLAYRPNVFVYSVDNESDPPPDSEPLDRHRCLSRLCRYCRLPDNARRELDTDNPQGPGSTPGRRAIQRKKLGTPTCACPVHIPQYCERCITLTPHRITRHPSARKLSQQLELSLEGSYPFRLNRIILACIRRLPLQQGGHLLAQLKQ